MEWVGWSVGYLWSTPTFFFLMGAGVLFTVWVPVRIYMMTRSLRSAAIGMPPVTALTHGVQVTRGIYDNPDDPGAISHFQALSAALSATIGLGNIGGVALAIGVGGPGALFWMWAIGLLGMTLKTVEITLAMLYRNTDDPENPHGGAMWVIDQTLGKKGGALGSLGKAMAVFFCLTLLISTFTGGNMFQSWNVADLTNVYFGVPQVGTGIVLALIVGMVIIGGIKRIGNVAGRLVPFMCILYVLASLAVIVVNWRQLPGLLALIVYDAFNSTDAVGAFVGGSAYWGFTIGLKRALFSNEAGQGSAPIAHSAAKTDEPAREGIVGGIGPFIDTIIVCTLTALVILSTGTWNRDPLGELSGSSTQIVGQGENARLDVPTSVGALPELASWENWQAGMQVFLLVEVLDEDEAGTTRRKVLGTIEADESGEASTISWDPLPAGARWTTRDDGTPETAVYRDFKGASLTAHAFDRAFPGLGKFLVTLAAWLFAISTMISWSYYGEQGVVYMLGDRAILSYKLIFCLAAILAPALVSTDIELGNLADFGTGWMLWANMPIVLLMGGYAVRAFADYMQRLGAGEFHPHAPPPLEDVVSGHDVERD